MSPETQDLESFFKNIKRNDGLPGDFEPGEDGKQEFDSFFEKLSSLDDMNWDINADPTLDQEEKNSSTEIKPVNSVNSSEQKFLRARKNHKMTIFHNKGEMKPVNQTEPESYDWRKELLGENSKPEEFGAQKKLKAAGKFILMAFLLFATGVGAGWLALSLPNRFNHVTSRISALPKENRAKAQEYYKNPNWETAQGVKQETLTVIDLTNNKEILPQNTKPERNSAAKIANNQAPKQMKIKTGRGKYSLQVGACQSEKCVNNYRKILQSYVNLESIQVLEKLTPGGKNIIRRIRIAPLNRVDARTLKSKLAATDPRFKDAYLVNLK